MERPCPCLGLLTRRVEGSVSPACSSVRVQRLIDKSSKPKLALGSEVGIEEIRMNHLRFELPCQLANLSQFCRPGDPMWEEMHGDTKGCDLMCKDIVWRMVPHHHGGSITFTIYGLKQVTELPLCPPSAEFPHKIKKPAFSIGGLHGRSQDVPIVRSRESTIYFAIPNPEVNSPPLR